MSLAIVPGSYDPMTLGHLDVVEYAARKYDKVVVAVMINEEKQYLYPMETRLEIARRTVAHLPNVRVLSDTGLLVDLYERLGADAVCKGWRNETDYAYETQMDAWNRAHNVRFHTELIRSSGRHSFVSSTAVRNALKEGKDPSAMVHPDALDLILSARIKK